ncbi:DMT family transporter [Candidatus Gottesmanbacteria bacterium]|nr:DMT family transporter [Candidatus Gottesmanbacteria bacterium]
MTTRQKAVLALITANMIWGAASPIFKWALINISPFLLAFLRFSIASILLFPFVYKKLSIDKKDIIKIIIIGLFGVGIHIPLFFFGLTLTPSINAPIIASSGPVFIIILSMIMLKEKPRRKVLFGTFISLLGVVVIIGRPLIEQGLENSSFIGNLLILLAVITGVFYTIYSKELLFKYSASTVTFWSFVVGSLTFIPFLLIEISNPKTNLVINYQGYTGIIFGVIFSSLIAYLLYQWGVQKINASEVGIFTYIDPVIAILIAYPLLGEVITPIFVLGSFLVFGGIFVAEGRFPYHPIPHLFGNHKPVYKDDRII